MASTEKNRAHRETYIEWRNTQRKISFLAAPMHMRVPREIRREREKTEKGQRWRVKGDQGSPQAGLIEFCGGNLGKWYRMGESTRWRCGSGCCAFWREFLLGTINVLSVSSFLVLVGVSVWTSEVCACVCGISDFDVREQRTCTA